MSIYTETGELGSGGFGIVHQCNRAGDGNFYAKKTLVKDDAEIVRRFQKEVRYVSKLDHPRIVKILDFRLLTPPYFYVMPLYRCSLRSCIRDYVGDEQRIAVVFSAVLEAVQYAHKQGIIHRDMKPENILLNSDTDIVLCDFGLGRSIDSASTRVTVSGEQWGTFGYVAPEQIDNFMEADHRCDIFALGRLLYEMSTGRRPGITHELSSVPHGIRLIIERATAAEPSERFQTVDEMRIAFAAVTLAYDLSDSQTRLEALLAKAVATGSFSSSEASEFGTAILRVREDEDFLHQVVVKLPEQGLRDLWHVNRSAVRLLLEQFSKNVASQGWGFTYVDTIGDACCKVIQAIPHPEERAIALATMAKVGLEHNRWNVIRRARRVIESVRDPGEGLSMANALQASQVVIDNLGVKRSTVVDVSLRALIREDDTTQ